MCGIRACVRACVRLCSLNMQSWNIPAANIAVDSSVPIDPITSDGPDGQIGVGKFPIALGIRDTRTQRYIVGLDTDGALVSHRTIQHSGATTRSMPHGDGCNVGCCMVSDAYSDVCHATSGRGAIDGVASCAALRRSMHACALAEYVYSHCGASVRACERVCVRARSHKRTHTDYKRIP
jgi:hypothetical protein